jgi:hypothetical protein
VSLTLLHFGNLRLGTAFPWLGVRGKDQRAQLLTTLMGLGDLAIAERVNMVVISGDLFDCVIPAESTLRSVATFFSKLVMAGIYVAVLPGKRDRDILSQFADQTHPVVEQPAVVVLNQAVPNVSLPALRLALHAITTLYPSEERAAARARDAGVRHIGLLYHGTATPLVLEDVARALQTQGYSYVGIGGYESYAEHVAGRMVLCSPGVAEPSRWGQEHGSLAVVSMDDAGGTQVFRGLSGTRTFARIELRLAARTAGQIRERIEALRDPELGLEIVLTGICPADVLIDPGDLEASLADRFFRLRVFDRTGVVIDEADAANQGVSTVLANFVRVMKERIEQPGPQDNVVLLREAYRLGFRMLDSRASRE